MPIRGAAADAADRGERSRPPIRGRTRGPLVRCALALGVWVSGILGATPPVASALTIASRFVGPGADWLDPANWSPLLAAAPRNDASAGLAFDVSIATPECPASGVALLGAGSPVEIDRLTVAALCRLEIGAGDELRILREAALGGALAVHGGRVVVQGRRVLAARPDGVGPISLSVGAGGTLDLSHIDRYATSRIDLRASDGRIELGSFGGSVPITIELEESPGGPGSSLVLEGIVQFLGESRLVAATAEVTVSGWLLHDQVDPSDFDLSSATVRTEGRTLIEAAGLDVGTNCSLFPDMNFGIGQLVVGSDSTSSAVGFGGAYDHGRAGGPGGLAEALYLVGPGTGDPCARTGGDGLVIAPGSRVVVGGSRAYAYQASTNTFVSLDDLVSPSVLGCVPAFGGEVCREVSAYSDQDADLIPSQWDNCTFHRNGPRDGSPQLDADLDGYGDRCDADYDQNLSTSVGDFAAWLAGFGRPGDRFDHDGDGYVTVADFAVYLSKFAGIGAANAPGPSGLACAGAPTCESAWP